MSNSSSGPGPSKSAGISLLGAAGLVVSGIKLFNSFTDEVYPGKRVPARVRRELLEEQFANHGCTCTACGKRRRKVDFQVDHKIPLSKGGSNSRNNLRVICKKCNASKGNKHGFLDWLFGVAG